MISGLASGDHDRLYDGAAIFVLLVLSVIALLTWGDHGLTWDEPFHVAYGDHLLAFYATGFEDQTALSFRLNFLYGGTYDLVGALFAELAKPLDRYDSIHLLGAIVGVVGLWGTWKLGRVLGGPRVGLLAVMFIGATSVYWGHMTNNPKDLPFAVGYVWAMAFLVQAIRSFPRVPARLAVKLALAFGLAMGVRIAGLLLVCYLGAAMFAWVVHFGLTQRDREANYRHASRLARTGLAVAAGAWAVMVSTWPWALYDPLRRPLIALRQMSHYTQHERPMPFAGEIISTLDVDWRYLLHYFGLKLPEFIVVLFVLGTLLGLGLLVWRARRVRAFSDNLVLATVLVSLWFPWAYAVYRESVLYDGLRHFLFEVPVMVAFAAWVMDALIEAVIRRFGKIGAASSVVLVLALCVDQYRTMIHLHPHEYVYFNRFIGGVEGAVGNYSTDYYAETFGEAGEMLGQHLWEHEPELYLHTMYRVVGCAGEPRAMRRLPPNFKFRARYGDPFDFWMAYSRRACDRHHSKSPLLFELRRQGGMLALVRDLRTTGHGVPRKRRKAHKRPKAKRPKPKRPKPKPKPKPDVSPSP